MPLVTVTNITTSPVFLRDMYTTVPVGGTVQTSRSPADLMSMGGLQEQVSAGNITVVFTYTADELAAGYDPLPGISEDETSHDVTDVITANVDAQYGQIIICDSTAGGFNVNLPAITTESKASEVKIKASVGAPGDPINTITVVPNGSDTIEGLSDFQITSARTGLLLVSDGSGTWMIF